MCPNKSLPSRRSFLGDSFLGGAGVLLSGGKSVGGKSVAVAQSGHSLRSDTAPIANQVPLPRSGSALDLKPAKWIWFPSGRCLPNTFVLFRKKIHLSAKPIRATGWLLGDSRYQLLVNGKRIQWGPAPADPRWSEADPLDLSSSLREGENVIGAQVLFYGHGDGTLPIGKPGFIFLLELYYADGKKDQISSDASWMTMIPRSWKPGQYKRWYLRSLQEEFDAREYPYGWSEAGFDAGGWLPALELDCQADKPSLVSGYDDYLYNISANGNDTALRTRKIPMLPEKKIPVSGLRESMWINWTIPAYNYFEHLTPDSFQVERTASARETKLGTWTVDLRDGKAAALTFEMGEQVVG